MNTCNSCRYSAISSHYAVGWALRCEHPCMGKADPYGNPAQRNGAMLIDENHGGAEVIIGPDFGCIHYFERDPPIF